MYFYDEREKLKDKLYTFLFGDVKEFVLYVPNITKEYGEEEYQKSVKFFKKAFNAGDEDLKIALWNELIIGDYDESDFTKEECDFIKQRIECKKKASKISTPYGIGLTNINDSFSSERLLFVPSKQEDEVVETYKEHYRNDECFDKLVSFLPTEENIDYCVRSLFDSFQFLIYEKDTRRLVGNIGMEWISENLKKGDISYYIFKEFREKRYTEEAIEAFIQEVFSNKLKTYEQTVQEDVFVVNNKEIELITKKVRNDDSISQRILESCGFEKVGIEHRTTNIDGKYFDSCVFELMKG